MPRRSFVRHWPNCYHRGYALRRRRLLAAIRNDEKGLGKEFLEGLHAIGYVFVPVAGIMASGPLLTKLIQTLVGPLYQLIGADPSLAATSLIAVDMGGYQVAHGLAQANPEHWQENWIMAMFTGYMAGATIVFSIPVGLSLLEKRDHKYMALASCPDCCRYPSVYSSPPA